MVQSEPGEHQLNRIDALMCLLSPDKLLQLVDAIRGEMSLVGPCPPLPWRIEVYTPEQRREAVQPSITGP